MGNIKFEQQSVVLDSIDIIYHTVLVRCVIGTMSL